MYPTTLLVHSWLRWVVIILGVWTVVDAARGRGTDRPGLFFTIALDVQLLARRAVLRRVQPHHAGRDGRHGGRDAQ